MIHAITEMNLENITFSERRQMQRKYTGLFHLYKMSRTHTHLERQKVNHWLQGTIDEEVTANDYGDFWK